MSLRDGFHRVLSMLDNAFTLVHFTGRRRSRGRRDNVKYAFLQAGAVAGWSFFTTLASLRLVMYNKPVDCLVAAFINSGIMFFTVLMIKLGILNLAEEAERVSGS